MKPGKCLLPGLEESYVVPLGKIGNDLRYECSILFAAKDRTLLHEGGIPAHVLSEDEDGVRRVGAGECGEIGED